MVEKEIIFFVSLISFITVLSSFYLPKVPFLLLLMIWASTCKGSPWATHTYFLCHPSLSSACRSSPAPRRSASAGRREGELLGQNGASTRTPWALLSQSHQPWEPCKAQVGSVLIHVRRKQGDTILPFTGCKSIT